MLSFFSKWDANWNKKIWVKQLSVCNTHTHPPSQWNIFVNIPIYPPTLALECASLRFHKYYWCSLAQVTQAKSSFFNSKGKKSAVIEGQGVKVLTGSSVHGETVVTEWAVYFCIDTVKGDLTCTFNPESCPNQCYLKALPVQHQPGALPAWT